MALKMDLWSQITEGFECYFLERDRVRMPFPAMEKRQRKLWAEGQRGDEQFNQAK